MKLLKLFNYLENKKFLFLLILLFASILFRLPTLFNDFYEVDELSAMVQTYEYLAGDTPGKDFAESKLPLYHALFKIAYHIRPVNGWIFVHIFTIFIVFLTSFYIFKIGKKINNFNTGALASILYAVFISSFNRHFMATNGEIIYNLPLTAGLYYFILFLSNENWKKILYFSCAVLMGIAAANVKFHGSIFFIFLCIFLIIYYPFYTNRFTKKYLYIILLIFIIPAIALIIDYYFTGLITPSIVADIEGKLVYASMKGFDPFTFFIKFLHRQGMLSLWHFVLWIPAAIYIVKFLKNKLKTDTIEESTVAVFFILTYAMIFGGGSRLYFHYFMASYPTLCVLSSIAINKYSVNVINQINKKFTVFLLIPSVFFFIWNIKDIIIKHYYPNAFHYEGKILYWTRAVLVGAFNDYLLPGKSYINACDFIKTATKPGERIFVWGDGPLLYYFSNRRMGTYHLWPKTSIFNITRLYEKGDNESIEIARSSEYEFINTLKTKKPVLFIDTSENGLSSFYFQITPLINKFVGENYYLLKEVNKMKIYKLKDR